MGWFKHPEPEPEPVREHPLEILGPRNLSYDDRMKWDVRREIEFNLSDALKRLHQVRLYACTIVDEKNEVYLDWNDLFARARFIDYEKHYKLDTVRGKFDVGWNNGVTELENREFTRLYEDFEKLNLYFKYINHKKEILNLNSIIRARDLGKQQVFQWRIK